MQTHVSSKSGAASFVSMTGSARLSGNGEQPSGRLRLQRRLRAARSFAFSNVYAKPYLDLGVSYSRMPAYQESSAKPQAPH